MLVGGLTETFDLILYVRKKFAYLDVLRVASGHPKLYCKVARETADTSPDSGGKDSHFWTREE